jgi:hypothetical protein
LPVTWLKEAIRAAFFGRVLKEAIRAAFFRRVLFCSASASSYALLLGVIASFVVCSSARRLLFRVCSSARHACFVEFTFARARALDVCPCTLLQGHCSCRVLLRDIAAVCNAAAFCEVPKLTEKLTIACEI